MFIALALAVAGLTPLTATCHTDQGFIGVRVLTAFRPLRDRFEATTSDTGLWPLSKEIDMRSLAGAFPDARVLLALDPDQLAGLFLFYFRALPWRDPRAVRRCIAHWAVPYPEDIREQVIDALTAAWQRLHAENLLAEPPQAPRTDCPMISIRLTA